MSEDFGEVDITNLPFPSYMMIDYIRVYQRPNQLNVGCSPASKPTSQWINCHKDLYQTSSKDDILFGPCNGAGCAKPALAAIGAVLAFVALFL